MAELVFGGKLNLINATQLRFIPYGGDRIKLAGTLRQIPAVGINVANTSVLVNGASASLAASTAYLVNLIDVAGTLTLEFRTTLTHAPSMSGGNEGIEVWNGDVTRTVIGMIRTDASGQFVDTAAQRFVSSWYNPVRRALLGALFGSFSTTSTSFVELSTNKRVEWVAFDREMLDVSLHSNVSVAAAGSVATASIYITPVGVYASEAACAPGVANGVGTLATRYCQQIATVGEGYGSAGPYVAAPGGSNSTFGATYVAGAASGRLWGHLTG